MKAIKKIRLPALVAAFAFASITAFAQPTLEIKQDAVQLQSDKDALQRQLKRLATDEARLKSDTASGRMSAMSKDAYEVYKAEQAIKGGKKVIAADKEAAPQMKADKAALQRQLKRLELAEARLKADKASGKMAAESKDSMKVYKDKQAVKGAAQAVVDGEAGSLQMKSDMATLQRALTRLDADEAKLKADKASGKMSAMSEDAYKVYKAKQAVKGGKENIADDEAVSMQMKADKAALQRQLKRLELAEATLKADKASGKMAAESKDSIKVYKNEQNIKATTKQIAADKAELKAEQKK